MFREIRADKYVRAIGCGLPTAKYRKRRLAVIRAFIDDSGHGGDSRYCVLAGYAATLPIWESFANDWQTALATHPAIEYFKMREAESRKDQFSGFDVEARNRKVNTLIDVVLSHDLFEGSCRLESDAYEEILKPLIKNDADWDDPYMHLMAPLVTLFASAERRYLGPMRSVPDSVVLVGADAPTEPIDFVFDSLEHPPKRRETRLKRSYERFKTHPLYRQSAYVGSIDYRDDKEFLPLQAADLIAWQDRRRLCAVAEGTRVEYERLHRDPLRHYHEMIDRAKLRKQAKQIVSMARQRQSA